MYGRVELVRELLRTDAGRPAADIETQDNAGNTPLHIAAQCGRDNVVEELLRPYAVEDRSTAISSENGDRKTPLDLAEEIGAANVIALLKAARAPNW
jgi:ankyrin repeat protein